LTAPRKYAQHVRVNLLERLWRWWKPAEYDEERRASQGEGHPLSAEERAEEREPDSLSDINRTAG